METVVPSILLIDDDPHACNIFQLVMDHYQLPLTIANDAETGISYLQDHTPDIVVVDLFLPGLDGYQAMRHMREMRLSSKIIATTAYHTNDTSQEVKSRGFDGYLPKPLETDTLISHLQAFLEE